MFLFLVICHPVARARCTVAGAIHFVAGAGAHSAAGARCSVAGAIHKKAPHPSSFLCNANTKARGCYAMRN